VAQIFIYCGLIFMTGKLLPNLLTPIYHLLPTPSNRLLFSSLTAMLIGNYFFQYLYSLQRLIPVCPGAQNVVAGRAGSL